MEAKEQQFFTSKELAEYVNVSVKFIEKYTSSGRLPGLRKMGRCVRWDKNAVDRRILSGNILLPMSENILLPKSKTT